MQHRHSRPRPPRAETLRSTSPTTRTATRRSDLLPPSDVEALLFDLDGTLVDSFGANLRAYNSALEPLGIELPREWLLARFGLAAPELLEAVQRSWDADFDTARMVAEKNRAYLGLVSEIETFPETLALLHEFGEMRPIGVVTSGPRETAGPIMRHSGLVALVDTLVTRDDVASTKPSPEAYLLAADRLAVSPKKCVVYEDTDAGISAAVSAGMDVIDVRNICVPQ